MNKKVKYLTLFIVLLMFCLSCSYATDELDDGTSIISDDNIIKTMDESTKTASEVKVSTYDSLANELNDKTTDKTINMDKGTYTITNPITMSTSNTARNVVLNGNGATIDGKNSKTFLTLNNNQNLEINNLIIKNNKGTSTGAIVIQKGATLKLNNCTFINNVADENGGAIVNRGNLIISNSKFSSNTAKNGGAIWCTSTDAGSLIIDQSTFSENKANKENNYDKKSVIYVVDSRNVKITSNTFENNDGKDIHAYLSTVLVSGNTFKNINLNVPSKYIQGAVIDNYEGDITIINNTFDNINVNALKVSGGLFYNEIGTSTFSNNKISNVKITSKTDNVRGGVLFNRNSTLTVANNIIDITNNGVNVHGGALYNNIGTLNVTKNTFNIDNTASNNIRGGAIYNDNDSGKNSVLYHGGNDFTNIKNTGKLYEKEIYNIGTVQEITVPNEATIITVNSVKGIIGNSITLTASIKDINGKLVNSGNAVFKINGKTISSKISVKNGAISTTLNAIKAYNNANISVSYSGAKGLNANTSKTFGKISLSLREAIVKVTTSPVTPKQYDTITFTANIIDKATGKVVSDNTKAYAIFKINGKTIKDSTGANVKVAVKNGVATYNYVVPQGMAGTSNGQIRYYNVTACVNHPDFSSVRNQTRFTVERSNVTVTTTKVVADTTSKKLVIEGNIKDYKGNNVVGVSKVNIKLNGKTLKINNSTTTSVSNGTIVLTLDLPAVKTITSITIVVGERGSYYGYRGNVTDITLIK